MFTIVNPQAYSPDEYNIVALPSSTLRQQIIDIQKKLAQLLGDAIWFTPPDALHITIMEITGPNTKPVNLRRQRYLQWQEDYGQTAKTVIAAFPMLSLRFNQILVSQ